MSLGNLNEKARDFVESMIDGEPRRPTVLMPPPTERPAGVFNYRVVRTVLFGVISLAIVATGAVCILAVWDVLTPQLAWRIALTFLIAVLSLTLFTAANEGFANSGIRRDDE
jgi:hypothetical protein